MKILIIDDEPSVCSYTARVLAQHDHDSQSAGSYEEGMQLLNEPSEDGWDLILLDISLPGRSGYEFLQDIRKEGSKVPVIFLTGHGAVDYRVKGLNLGADDFIAKPFESKELIARIEAVARRSQSIPTYTLGELKIDPARQLVMRGEQRLDMTPREFAVLLELIWAEGRVVSKNRLLSNVWGMEHDPGTKIVEVQIARLRKKLGAGSQPAIETVVGEGYRLMASRSRDLSTS
ncbi:MAG: two-component system copper resistance phosphate regulon response regulator CusR [Planctomycetota bacterium]|jgi:two-component system copper resistance phosphate regulon response regulator CusR